MKVRDVCIRTVRSCRPDTTLAAAGWSMWEGDCGILPVVDADNKLLGVITDRDICMAVATKYRPAADIAAWEVLSGKAYSCRLDDDAASAMATMAKKGVRRLPVVDAEGRLQGILSMNDLALVSRPIERVRAGGITYEDFVPTMQAICAHRTTIPKAEKPRLPAPRELTATAAP